MCKGSNRKLGGLGSGRRNRVLCAEYGGPRREGEEPKPMMHGPEKSDLAIVAMKPAKEVAPRCGNFNWAGIEPCLLIARIATESSSEHRSR
jgi:hypothetical protein